MNTQSHSPTTKNWIALWMLGLIWGCSFILIKRGLLSFTPVQVASLRIAVAAIAFLPFTIFHWKKIDWSRWHHFAIVGLAGSGVPAFLFSFAQLHIDSTVSGILNSLTPLFTFLVGIWLYGNKPSPSRFIGVGLGLLGAACLVFFGKTTGQDSHIGSAMLIVLATMCYAISVNTVKTHLSDINPIVLSSVAFQFLSIPALGILFYTDFQEMLQTKPDAIVSLGSIVVLGLMGTFLASILFFDLVQKTDALFGSMTTYIIPITAIMLGIWDGEHFTLLHIFGMSFILLGVYISRK